MTLAVKLAGLRAHHDSAYPVLKDQACWEMLVANPSGTAVLQYWSQVTGGHLEFTVTMFPWVEVNYYDPKMARADQLSAAVDATRRVTNDLFGEYDGFVLLVYPGLVQVAGTGQQAMTDAGAVGFDASRKCAVLHYATRDHTFMSHEVGHVLGFEHSFGLTNTGMDWDGMPPWKSDTEYGDPYDVMSSASFGRCADPSLGVSQSNPATTIPTPPDWFVASPGAGLMGGSATTNAGPAPALAHVDWKYPDALGRAVARLPMPVIGQPPTKVRLHAADVTAGTRLITISSPTEPRNGLGRVYLEYRRSAGWDAGLDVTGADLAREAVVAHTVSMSYVGPRIWYRNRILVPLSADTDMQVLTTPLSVRAVGVGEGFVDLELVYGTDRGIVISTRRQDEVATSTVTATSHTPCGDRVRQVNRLFRTTMGFLPAVRGFDGNTPVTWRVDGAVVRPTMTLDTPDGPSELDVRVDAATQELTLTSTRGHRYNVEVTASVTEPGGTLHTATAAFDPTGSYIGVAPEDQHLLDKCWERWAKSKRLQKYQQLRVRDLFRRGPEGRKVLDGRSIDDALVEVLGQQRVDELEPEARTALEQLLRMSMR